MISCKTAELQHVDCPLVVPFHIGTSSFLVPFSQLSILTAFAIPCAVNLSEILIQHEHLPQHGNSAGHSPCLVSSKALYIRHGRMMMHKAVMPEG